MNKSLPPWSSVTREERYFSSSLFHELVRDPEPFWRRTVLSASQVKESDLDAKKDQFTKWWVAFGKKTMPTLAEAIAKAPL